MSFSLAIGTELKNIVNLQGSISYSTLKTRESSRRESRRLTVNVFTLILRFATTSLSIICHSKNFLSSIPSKSTGFFIWQPPQNTSKNVVKLKRQVFFMKYKLILVALWTKSSWKKQWLNPSMKGLRLFQLIWLYALHRLQNLALTSAKFRSLSTNSRSHLATFALIHFS